MKVPDEDRGEDGAAAPEKPPTRALRNTVRKERRTLM
jgi:hypothetical protein